MMNMGQRKTFNRDTLTNSKRNTLMRKTFSICSLVMDLVIMAIEDKCTGGSSKEITGNKDRGSKSIIQCYN